MIQGWFLRLATRQKKLTYRTYIDYKRHASLKTNWASLLLLSLIVIKEHLPMILLKSMNRQDSLY